MKLEGTVSLVTGAAQGIGKAIALSFAREGSTVIVNDVDLPRAGAVAAEIDKSGGKAFPIKADVSRSQEVKDMVKEAIRSFGKIDILVNNAGMQTERAFLRLSEKEWQRVVDVNLKGVFLCSQAVAREMIKQGTGKIINISSIHQLRPRSNIAHYAASKGGVMMLSKVMALELARYRINVNCVAPGAIATAMNQALVDSPELLSRMNSQIPWGRMGTTEDVAEAALFLASGDAEYITGSTIYVEGGLSLGGLDIQ